MVPGATAGLSSSAGSEVDSPIFAPPAAAQKSGQSPVSRCMAETPSTNVGPNDVIVDQRREDVAQQNGQHDALGEAGVDHPNQDDQHADQCAVNPLPERSNRRADRIRCTLPIFPL